MDNITGQNEGPTLDFAMDSEYDLTVPAVDNAVENKDVSFEDDEYDLTIPPTTTSKVEEEVSEGPSATPSPEQWLKPKEAKPFRTDFEKKALRESKETKEALEQYLTEQSKATGKSRDDLASELLRSTLTEKTPEGERGLDPVSAGLLGAVSMLGEDGLNGLMYVSDLLAQGTGKALDSVEEFFVGLQDTLGKDTYDTIFDVSPNTAAKRVAKDANMLLDTIDFIVPVVPSGAATAAAKAVVRSPITATEALVGGGPRRLDALKAQLLSSERVQEAQAAAKKVAEGNKDLRDQLILGFEEITGRNVSDKVGKHLTINPDKTRKAGVETMDSLLDETDRVFGETDSLLGPILNPENLDALVAVTADLQKMYPDAFDPKKKVIDNLVELTIDKDMLASKELTDLLGKYGLSYENYILTVVGSGSQAGKVLNKLSQMRRARPKNVQLDAARKAREEEAGAFRKFVMRVENVRRGGLVSQFSTAARNFTSAIIRAPLEGLANVMDSAIVAAQKADNKGAGMLEGMKTVASASNWKESFRAMDYIFRDNVNAKEIVELITNQPEMNKQWNLLFNNLNEIHEATGRGSGTRTDKVLSEAEDLVDALNVPNRWQEHLVRRGVFLNELERLVKQEYGVDFIDELVEKGRMRDFMEDRMTPEGARPFAEIAADATNKALDVTYAKQPDVPVFRSMSQFIVRNGLTVAIPFPRFMFNAMELMGQYGAGASIPLTRKIASIVTGGKVGKGPLSAKDRERITRNMMGIAAIGAAYQYRSSEDAPSAFYEVEAGDEAVADIRPQFPMAQFMYLGEAVKRIQDGTFNTWFKSDEFVETFTGSNFRTGVGNSVLDEVADIATGTDLTSEEAAGKALGGALGNYLSTWAVPFAQIIDGQRASGTRGTEFKDVAEDPTLSFGETFTQELERPFRQRGFTLSPEEEAQLRNREYIMSEDKERVSPATKMTFGLSFTTKESELGQFLGDLGYNDFTVNKPSNVPSVRAVETKRIREALTTALPEIREVTDRYEDPRMRNIIGRSVVESIITSVKTELEDAAARGDDVDTVDIDATRYARAQLQFRQLKPTHQQFAIETFKKREGREPDGTNVRDIEKLGQIGATFRKSIQ